MEEVKEVQVEEPKKEEVIENKEVIIDRYTKDIPIPSNGYLGGPKNITIRAMTAAEEKILYSARDFNFIQKVCKACTVKPKVLDLATLTAPDIMFILYQIRELTFGPTYKQPIRCPFCGTQQFAEINIANFEYTILPDDIEEKLFITLPISKLGVHLRLLSQQEIDNIENEVITMYDKGAVRDLEGTTMMKKICAMISDIVGQEFENDNDKFAFLQKMHLQDFNAIENALGNIKYGLVNNTEHVCTNCEKKVEVTGTICPEFFRPTE